MKSVSFGNRIHGFTLIELLIVLSIIGIMAGVGFSGNRGIHKWMAQVKTADMFSNLELSCRLYKADNGNWPPSLRVGEVQINKSTGSWRTDLAVYLREAKNGNVYRDGYGNEDIRIVLDSNGDNRIQPEELPGLPAGFISSEIWMQVAIYSLDANGKVAFFNWDSE